MRYYCTILLILLSNLLLSQNYRSTLKVIRTGDIEKSYRSLYLLDSNSFEFKTLSWKLRVLKIGKNDSILHREITDFPKLNYLDSLMLSIYLADYYYSNNNQDSAYYYYDSVYKKSLVKTDSLLVCYSIYNLLELTIRNRNIRDSVPVLLSTYKNYAYNDLEKAYAQYYHHYFKSEANSRIEIDSVRHRIEVAIKSKSNFCLIETYQRIGVEFDVYSKYKDSSIYYYNKAIKLIQNRFDNYHFVEQRKKGILNNIGCIYYDKEEFHKALIYFNKAFEIKSTRKRLINDSIISSWLIKTYKKLNKLDSAMYYVEVKDSISKKLNQVNYALKIDELNKKYGLSKERNKNLLLDKKRIINRNVYITLIFVIIIIVLSAYLIFKNLSRKKELVEKEKQIQIERTEKLLKQQELSSIDAMIEGQEKERQRIANELHDDLGGLLATLKLYVQNLKVKKTKLNEQHDTIIKNTDTVLEEAYQKVRSIAQTRNAGVLTSEGLIPTIQNYAAKISASNSLIVEVEDYGMEQRLKNTTEILIFRVIQELITNVIKHAQAKKITIHITNHEESINVMVEDDGIGFDSSAMKVDKGMGLTSIQKRIESLQGNFSIDSKFHRGTTIIIDIPVE